MPADLTGILATTGHFPATICSLHFALSSNFVDVLVFDACELGWGIGGTMEMRFVIAASFCHV